MTDMTALRERRWRARARYAEEIAAIAAAEEDAARRLADAEELLRILADLAAALDEVKVEIVLLARAGKIPDVGKEVKWLQSLFGQTVSLVERQLQAATSLAGGQLLLGLPAVEKRLTCLRDELAELYCGWPWLEPESLPKPDPEQIRRSREEIARGDWVELEDLLGEPENSVQ